MSAQPRLLPLHAGDTVALLPDRLPPVAATVVATASEAATLLLGDRALPARMLHRRRAALERAQDGRRFRGEGRLAMAAGHRGRAREDTVVFHFGAPPRRAHERAPAIVPVTLVPLDAPVPPARAEVDRQPAGGALVRGPVPLDRGHELHVHLQLPEEELPIPAAGAVVRRTPEGLLGVRLDRMRPADLQLVRAWLRDQQRRVG